MDVIFDIDGTLANAAHRLHFIDNPCKPKDWDNFLCDEQIAKDTPIEPMWSLLLTMLECGHRICFITGRPDSQAKTTRDWLFDRVCPLRKSACDYWESGMAPRPLLYMRRAGDRRSSQAVKEELLHQAMQDGLKPVLVFEDRKDDTYMWRRNGLLCCQVAEGDY